MLVVALVGACRGSEADTARGRCARIFERRINGIHTPHRVYGPRHRDAFMKACTAMPAAYLECETRDALRLGRSCLELFRATPYRRQLDDVLITGAIAPPPRQGPPIPAGEKLSGAAK